MMRKAFVMSVIPGCETAYESRHNLIWPKLKAVLKAYGAHNYSIFLHRDTGQLFGYVEIEDETRWAAIAQTPECREWWAYMRDVMAYNPDGTPVAEAIREVFHLE